jgi:hypothetical protein
MPRCKAFNPYLEILSPRPTVDLFVIKLEFLMAETVKEGDWIALQSLGVPSDLVFTRFFPSRSVKVGGRKFRLSELPSPKYGCRVDFAVKAHSIGSDKKQEEEDGKVASENNDEVNKNFELINTYNRVYCTVTSQAKFVYFTRYR